MNDFLKNFNQLNLRFKLLFFAILIFVAIVVFGISSIRSNSEIDFILYPSPSQDIPTLTDELILTANKDISLDPKTLANNIQLSPDLKLDFYIEGRNIHCKLLSLLKSNTDYTLTIANLDVGNNRIVALKKFNFKTINLTADQVYQQQQDENKKLFNKFKLLEQLPIVEVQYTIDYRTIDKNKPTIVINTRAPLNRPEQFNWYVENSKLIRNEAMQKLDSIDSNWKNVYSVEFSPTDQELTQ